MKGIELPVNAIVIVAVAVLVLVVLAAFFSGMFGPNVSKVSAQSAWDTGCTMADRRGCLQEDFGWDGTGCYPDMALTVAGYDPDGDTLPNSILEACQVVYNTADCQECRNFCCGA